MIKIFYNNKFIQLSLEESDDNSLTKISFSDEELVKKQVNIFIDTNNSDNINIYNIHKKKYLEFFNTYLTFIQAAGGLVFTNNNEILLIERLGYIDLPKGKVEKGEEIKCGAIREVCEECGIIEKNISQVKEFHKTYHIYKLNEQNIIKETIWYTMLFSGENIFVPQTEEDISKVFMINISNITKYYSKTYKTIVELLDKFLVNNNCIF